MMNEHGHSEDLDYFDEEPSKESQVAFHKAIQSGRLSTVAKSPNFAGDFMYMGSQGGKDLFKHRDTRSYLP